MDAVFVILMLVFFALSWGFVLACDALGKEEKP
jgi:hypothetical protein